MRKGGISLQFLSSLNKIRRKSHRKRPFFAANPKVVLGRRHQLIHPLVGLRSQFLTPLKKIVHRSILESYRDRSIMLIDTRYSQGCSNTPKVSQVGSLSELSKKKWVPF